MFLFLNISKALQYLSSISSSRPDEQKLVQMFSQTEGKRIPSSFKPESMIEFFSIFSMLPFSRNITNTVRSTLSSYNHGDGFEQLSEDISNTHDNLPSLTRLNTLRIKNKLGQVIVPKQASSSPIIYRSLIKNTPNEDINGFIRPLYTYFPNYKNNDKSQDNKSQNRGDSKSKSKSNNNHHLSTTAGKRWRMRYTNDPAFTLHADHVLHNFTQPNEWKITGQ